MNFKTYIEKRRRLINEKLDEYLPGEGERPASLNKAIRYSVLSGGKRIRPIITLESCMVCGGKIGDGLAAACAIELVHAYSLVHDDLPAMDDDDYRRGKPTCHKVFGEANAILAGDALLTLAFNVLARGLAPEAGLLAVKELSEAVGAGGMVGGQALDLESKDKNRNKQTLDRINRLKTSMLFEVSCRLGAIVAGAAQKEIMAAADYGACLGMAFQITDDMIDGAYDKNVSAKAQADRDVGILSGKAKKSVKIFGGKADRLIEVVDYVSERSK